jgi:hypothetical protein
MHWLDYISDSGVSKYALVVRSPSIRPYLKTPWVYILQYDEHVLINGHARCTDRCTHVWRVL